MKYLTGCAELFRDGYTDLCQFTAGKGIVPPHWGSSGHFDFLNVQTTIIEIIECRSGVPLHGFDS